MSATHDDVRRGAVAAERLLRAGGIRDATVTVVGHAHDVAAVRAAHADFDAVAALAPALRRLGFRYVALDLAQPESAE